MMNQEYDVFICHRGTDTKRNVVSVLSGMLRSKGITCFVDYRMDMGKDVQSEIDGAIESSRVFIIILSPGFATSRWCLGEVVKIMNTRGVMDMPIPSRKVIPIFYNVRRELVQQQATGTTYDLSLVKWSNDAEREIWGKALKQVCSFKGFDYDSETMLQWEKSDEIVGIVEDFLISHHLVPNQGAKTPNSRECVDYDVFICHYHLDTQRNVVSVLRGMLDSKGITSFVVGYGKNDGRSELNSDIIKRIENSRVHVILLSPNFVSSKQCLEEVAIIMNMNTQYSRVLPIFYDVEPSTVRYQKAGTAYDLNNVHESTEEDRKRWASALRELSFLHGLKYKPDSTFQWEKLHDFVEAVHTSIKKVFSCKDGPKCEPLYLEKINEVFKELELREKSEHVFVVGVYGRRKSEFSNLLIENLGRRFNRVCEFINVMEKAYQRDGVSNIVRKMRSELIQPSRSNDVRRGQLILENERCLVILDGLGNDIDKIKKLLEEVKCMLRNRSLVVVASEFQHILQRLKVHKFINLMALENQRDFLSIYYSKRDRINEAFLSQLRETFDMLGLDVRLLNEDEVMTNITCLVNAKVVLCIVSKSFSIDDFESMFIKPAIPSRIVYVSYGSYPTDESIPKPLFKVDFEQAEFNRGQFKSIVNEVLQILNERREEIMGAIDFPVGLAQRATEIGCSMLECLSRSDDSVQCFGLVGMGGVGKTTIAMSIFNKMHNKFERSFFCLNTKSEVQKKGILGLIDVQKRILARLLKQTDDVTIDNVLHGKVVLSSRLKNLNALIVFDDVDDDGQLDALYEPLQSSLGPKSVVIITSRDHRIIESAQSTRTFEIEGLDREMAKCLFYWHAFKKPTPPPDLEEVSQRVIEACKGLPLSLKVIGSHLYRKFDRRYWEESLIHLNQDDNKIFKVLRISFEALDNKQKEAFLDICCFLIGEGEDFACMVLEAIYRTGRTCLDDLKDRCLITIDANNNDANARRIGMHDQLRDMGRHIIREERRDRAWDEESANDILQDEKARSSLRGLSIWAHFPFPSSNSISLPQLRILVVKEDFWILANAFLTRRERPCPQFFNNLRCDELRWLRWEGAPFEKLPHGLCCRNIRVLELSSSEINEVPTTSLSNLQHLDVSWCRKLKGLDSGIGRLTSLRYLKLEGCEFLTSLPNDMMSLSSLEVLILDGCRSLANLPFLPTTLRTLSVDMGPTYGSLKSVEDITNLRTLILDMDRNYGNVECVEDASLPNLTDLAITCCPKLKRLILHATSLQQLDLTKCEGLQRLDCKGLSCFEVDIVDDCPSPRKLSLNMDSIRNWKKCSLESVEDASLPNLTDLAIMYCPKLKRLALHATSLQRLDLTRCLGVNNLDCKGTSSLEFLILDQCLSLASRSFLPTTLQTFRLQRESIRNDGLELVEDALLPDSNDLTIARCPKLKRLAFHSTSLQRLNLKGHDGLQRLDLSGCEAPEDLECKGLLPSVEVLNCEDKSMDEDEDEYKSCEDDNAEEDEDEDESFKDSCSTVSDDVAQFRTPNRKRRT